MLYNITLQGDPPLHRPNPKKPTKTQTNPRKPKMADFNPPQLPPGCYLTGKLAKADYKQLYTFGTNDIGVRYYYGYMRRGKLLYAHRKRCRNTEIYPVLTKQSVLITAVQQAAINYHRLLMGEEIDGLTIDDFKSSFYRTGTRRYKRLYHYVTAYYIQQAIIAHNKLNPDFVIPIHKPIIRL